MGEQDGNSPLIAPNPLQPNNIWTNRMQSERWLQMMQTRLRVAAALIAPNTLRHRIKNPKLWDFYSNHAGDRAEDGATAETENGIWHFEA
jgi:hypothetical protein